MDSNTDNLPTSGPTCKQLLVARLAFIRRDLEEVLRHLSDDQLGYAPGRGVRPTYDQFLEIGMNEVMALALLRDGQTLTHAEAEARLSHEPTVASYRKMLTDVRAETVAYIEALTEADLAQPVEASNPWYASFGLESVPQYDALTSIAVHEGYHVGQLITYAWARGDDPYQW
ncbi:MAG: DinB family protein [Fimbriimonas sp.]